MVADALDAVADRYSACQALAFADLGTSMVLVTNSGTELSREHLDALCAEAAVTLGAPGQAALGQGPATLAMTSTPTHTKVFLRGGPDGTDGLCCLCAPSVNLGPFLADVQACFAGIVAG